MTKDAKFLVRTAKKASKLVTDDFDVKQKDNQGDLVTNLDLKIERFLIAQINKHYPGFGIVSEEFNNDAKPSENCFIIDPIDGTINFANHLSPWGIQIACIKNGVTVAAVIYLLSDKEMYYADETGAYLNGKRIHTKALPIKNCLYVNADAKRLPISRNLRYLGSSAAVCAFLAAGRLQAIMSRKTKLWDRAPGFYIIRQAGGVICEEEGCYMAACSQDVLDTFKEEFLKS